jgi:hypothetical protein
MINIAHKILVIKSAESGHLEGRAREGMRKTLGFFSGKDDVSIKFGLHS